MDILNEKHLALKYLNDLLIIYKVFFRFIGVFTRIETITKFTTQF